MRIETDLPDGVSVMLGSATSNPQDESGQQSCIRLTVTLPVNGLDYQIAVEETTPSTVVVSPTTSKSRVSSKRDTTDPTRTRSTMNPVTSIGSVTDVTTAGTRPTTPTTTPTSDGQETKSKHAGVSKDLPISLDKHGIPRHYKKAKGYSNLQTRNAAILRKYNKGESKSDIAKRMGLSRERVDQIIKKAQAEEVA